MASRQRKQRGVESVRKCSYCYDGFEGGEAIVTCSVCNALYHQPCWEGSGQHCQAIPHPPGPGTPGVFAPEPVSSPPIPTPPPIPRPRAPQPRSIHIELIDAQRSIPRPQPRPLERPASIPVRPQPTVAARLVAQVGAQRRAIFPLTQAITRIGREPDSTILLNDPTVSRRHAGIELRTDQTGPQFSLSDYGSTNGTFVNGRRVARAVLLRERDQIQIGHTLFRFEQAAATDTAAPPDPAKHDTRRLPVVSARKQRKR